MAIGWNGLRSCLRAALRRRAGEHQANDERPATTASPSSSPERQDGVAWTQRPERSCPTREVEARKTLQDELEEVRVDLIRLGALTTEAITAGTQAFLDGDLHDGRARDRGRRRDRRPLPLHRGPHHPDPGDAVAGRGRPPQRHHDAADQPRARARTRTSWSTSRRRPAASTPTSSTRSRAGSSTAWASRPPTRRRLAIDAFADRDPSWAAALADMDDAMDELSKSLFRHSLSLGANADEGTIVKAMQVALLSRALRADRRPRGDDRRAGAVHGHRPAPSHVT